MTRILLADDHALVRAGLRSMLEQMPGVEVVGEASDGHEALRLVAEVKPDLVLLDISMPGLTGLEVAERISRDHRRTRTVMLSMHFADEYVRRALRAGAAGYLLKDSNRDELERAVRAAARGETWLAPKVAKLVAAGFRQEQKSTDGPFERLTGRQREVLQLIAEGLSTKEIAQRMEISVKTVETHRAELMERLDIHGIAGLVRYAIRVGIVTPDR